MLDAVFWLVDYFAGLGKAGKLVAVASLLCLAVLAAFGGLALYVAFVGGAGPDSAAVPVEQQVVEVMGTPVPAPRLTHEAAERSRILAEHQTLIASLPPTREPIPLTPSDVATQQAAAAQVYDSGDRGLAQEPFPGEGWFDPDVGLYFWRENGGDWTTLEARESSPYWEYVEYDGYPPGVPNFADGSMGLSIARKMAFAMADARPEFGSVNQSMIRVLQSRLGWEFRTDAPDKANVWSYFTLVEGRYIGEFRIGGVVQFHLKPLPGGAAGAMYLDLGEFVGSFVVERAAQRVRID